MLTDKEKLTKLNTEVTLHFARLGFMDFVHWQEIYERITKQAI